LAGCTVESRRYQQRVTAGWTPAHALILTDEVGVDATAPASCSGEAVGA
jgi:hypothetical protein